jgi:hypothetical protein
MKSGGADMPQSGGADILVCLSSLCLFLILLSSPAFAADPILKQYESKYYLIHTDLPPLEAREAQVRMTRMADEYLLRTAGFSGQIKERLPFYLYKNRADYEQAGGIENSGGVFDGERLMAVTLRREDGVISLATWHIVQHEGFHQFAHAVINRDLPMWADEGLAEYFGEGLFTGDGFVTGLIPQSRFIRVQKMLVEARAKPLAEFLAITREQWNAKIEMDHYDQAWSFVHFLAHGEDGRLQKAFTNYMRDVSRGEDTGKCYNRYLKTIPNLETRWRDWWISLPDHPTAEGYARAMLGMLTSFLARAHAQGQAFASFEELAKTPADNLKQPTEDWLPPTLFAMAVNESAKMRLGGASFIFVKPSDHIPSIVLTLKDGTKLAGRFSVTKDGRIDNVRTDVLVKVPVRLPAATQPAAPRPKGELLH